MCRANHRRPKGRNDCGCTCPLLLLLLLRHHFHFVFVSLPWFYLSVVAAVAIIVVWHGRHDKVAGWLAGCVDWCLRCCPEDTHRCGVRGRWCKRRHWTGHERMEQASRVPSKCMQTPRSEQANYLLWRMPFAHVRALLLFFFS